jgi:hypothetical protein
MRPRRRYRHCDAALRQLRKEGFEVREEDVARLSPLGHEHINMLGRYAFSLPEKIARFPKRDADFTLAGLLAGVFGTREWMAARLGATGGRAKSEKKREAARNNGKLGGRPPKHVAGHDLSQSAGKKLGSRPIGKKRARG